MVLPPSEITASYPCDEELWLVANEHTILSYPPNNDDTWSKIFVIAMEFLAQAAGTLNITERNRTSTPEEISRLSDQIIQFRDSLNIPSHDSITFPQFYQLLYHTFLPLFFISLARTTQIRNVHIG